MFYIALIILLTVLLLVSVFKDIKFIIGLYTGKEPHQHHLANNTTKCGNKRRINCPRVVYDMQGNPYMDYGSTMISLKYKPDSIAPDLYVKCGKYAYDNNANLLDLSYKPMMKIR